MRFASVRELKNKTSEVLREAEEEDVVVTSQGKPRAIITAITEDGLEDYLLEHSTKFMSVLAEARKEYLVKGGTSLSEYRKARRFK